MLPTLLEPFSSNKSLLVKSVEFRQRKLTLSRACPRASSINRAHSVGVRCAQISRTSGDWRATMSIPRCHCVRWSHSLASFSHQRCDVNSPLQLCSRSINLQLSISSIKVEVKKKHFSFGWKFSCFSAHLIER